MLPAKIHLSTSGLDGFPWRDEVMSLNAMNCMSMLTLDEKQALYWATRRYYSGQGAIIDAGTFAGGSTMALATGLIAARAEPSVKIHCYDRFLSDNYMETIYFKPAGLAPEGKRFRHIFDRNTREVADRLIMHDGDIASFKWDGTPVEILFVDVCKAWQVNDHCTGAWFTNLIPNQSLVIQQDFYHHLCPWVVITMELLEEHFDFIGFVEWGTAIFRCNRTISAASIPQQLRALGHKRLSSLLTKHLNRYEAGFQRDMLSCALVVLHLDFNQTAAANEVYNRLCSTPKMNYAGRGLMDYTLNQLSEFLSVAKAS